MQLEKSDATRALRALAAACEAGGWVCTSLEIGEPAAAFRLELRQGNHMYVATIDYERRCVVEQFFVDRKTAAVGRKGDRALVERVNTLFLRRWRAEGHRSMLRIVARRTGLSGPMRALAGLASEIGPARPGIDTSNVKGVE